MHAIIVHTQVYMMKQVRFRGSTTPMASVYKCLQVFTSVYFDVGGNEWCFWVKKCYGSFLSTAFTFCTTFLRRLNEADDEDILSDLVLECLELSLDDVRFLLFLDSVFGFTEYRFLTLSENNL